MSVSIEGADIDKRLYKHFKFFNSIKCGIQPTGPRGRGPVHNLETFDYFSHKNCIKL